MTDKYSPWQLAPGEKGVESMCPEPDEQLISGGSERQPAGLSCPFCSKQGVEIKQVKELNPRGFSQGKLSDNQALLDVVILEYKARCSHCQRTYRQACPSNLMPPEYRTQQ